MTLPPLRRLLRPLRRRGTPAAATLCILGALARPVSAQSRDVPLPLGRAVASDSLLGPALERVPRAARGGAYIVVDLDARRLWYVDGRALRFVAPVGVGRDTPAGDAGSGGGGGGRHATPRAQFTVLRKDRMPVWVPPDWYYEEVAAETGLPLRPLQPGDTVRALDGSVYFVSRSEVTQRLATGEVRRVALADGAGARRELVVDGTIIVPPFGAAQRQYPAVLGPRRLAFRDGYAIHGTDRPETIGRAASHGCLRMHNADVVALFDLVPVGTPVFLH